VRRGIEPAEARPHAQQRKGAEIGGERQGQPCQRPEAGADHIGGAPAVALGEIAHGERARPHTGDQGARRYRGEPFVTGEDARNDPGGADDDDIVAAGEPLGDRQHQGIAARQPIAGNDFSGFGNRGHVASAEKVTSTVPL
jgi:hypothetical protein